ncbi:unnamed protein product [Rotaria magnacalcarata]|uniref:Uncharacterized protein n=1 Tax=Rotaria magnacalcarata TaxID=392030 RepID=A0A820GDV6_9BILA|nr:unnamed protein product [Rotaria magnacalcarata]
MGQQVSLTDLKTPDLLSTNNQQPNEVLSDDQTENIHLFLPFAIIKEINQNSSELSIAKEKLINQIRNDISVSSNLSGVNEFNAKIVEIIKKMLDYIATKHTCLQNSIQSIINKQKQLKDSYGEKLRDDENATTAIFPEALIDSEKVSNEQQLKELSFFAVESLIAMLLVLLKSVHNSDSTIVHQMLILKNQLLERIPLNYISSDICKRSNNLFKSLKPLTDFIQELSMQTGIDPFATSFKDILPLIRKIIFNTNDIFDVRKLFVKLNKHLMIRMDQSEKEKQTTSTATTIPQNTTNNNNLTTQEQNRTGECF